MINQEIREKFKKLYYEKFDITLSNEEATKMATDLINLVKVLLKPEPISDTIISTEERLEYETSRIQQY